MNEKKITFLWALEVKNVMFNSLELCLWQKEVRLIFHSTHVKKKNARIRAFFGREFSHVNLIHKKIK